MSEGKLPPESGFLHPHRLSQPMSMHKPPCDKACYRRDGRAAGATREVATRTGIDGSLEHHWIWGTDHEGEFLQHT